MSFYTEDFYESTQGTTAKDTFVCVNCSGSNSYEDATTGALCCSECFTQSQNIPTNDDQLDLDEIQGLAARTRSGFRSVHHSTGGKAGRPTGKKQPLEDLDRSRPLPNLVSCLHGIQRVLQEGTVCLGVILELDVSQQNAVTSSVHRLWRSYLKAWTEGAEYYGKLHPEVRFSMRDAFITKEHRKLVMRNLSHRVNETLIKQEEDSGEANELKSVHRQRAPLELGSDSESDSSCSEEGESNRSGENNDRPSSPGNEEQDFRQYHTQYSKPKTLLQIYGKDERKGHKEAALRLQPSMSFCTSLLWLAVSRLGITTQNMATWISNGSLPFLNAFDLLFTNEERQALGAIAHVFRLPGIPGTPLMEFQANLLVVACGLKSSEHLTGETTQEQSTKSIKDRWDGNGKDQNQAAPSTKVGGTKLVFIASGSVPLMTARFVNDLGLGQAVMDACLALMGIIIDPSPNVWLPAALSEAHPTKLTTASHVLAVIVVACKMCPGWENWAYRRPQSARCAFASKNKRKSHNIDESVKDRKSENIENTQKRFVPWNEQHFRLLGNGSMVKGYLDFIEETYLDHEKVLPKFEDFLSSLEAQSEAGDSIPVEGSVHPNEAFAGSRNPNRPEMWRREKHHDFYLRLQKQKAEWADSNGLGEYVIYANRKSHALSKKAMPGFRSEVLTPEPFHPHYGKFIEYVAYRTGVDPSDLHAMVAEFDEAVVQSVQTKRRPKRRRSLSSKNCNQKRVDCSEEKIIDGQQDLHDTELVLHRATRNDVNEDADCDLDNDDDYEQQRENALKSLLMLRAVDVPATRYI